MWLLSENSPDYQYVRLSVEQESMQPQFFEDKKYVQFSYMGCKLELVGVVVVEFESKGQGSRCQLSFCGLSSGLI